jgi:hypothetical protein
MLFALNDLRGGSASPTGHHESIPWRSVTGKMPLVTKTEFDRKRVRKTGDENSVGEIVADLNGHRAVITRRP